MKNLIFLQTSLFILFAHILFSQEVEINGALRIASSTDSTSETGTIRFNSETQDFEGFDGIQWKSLTNSSAAAGVLTDLDGNEYKQIVIGTQTWMRENLRTTKYKNGTPIPEVTIFSEWESLTIGGWSWLDNNFANEERYGKLYNWYATVDTNGLCPDGWRIPSDSDWTILIAFLDTATVDPNPGPEVFWQGTIAAFKINEVGSTHWASPNEHTNESGFTGLPGGIRYPNGPFAPDGTSGHWWSSTEIDSSKAYVRCTYFDEGRVLRGPVDKRIGYSIRCLKD